VLFGGELFVSILFVVVLFYFDKKKNVRICEQGII